VLTPVSARQIGLAERQRERNAASEQNQPTSRYRNGRNEHEHEIDLDEAGSVERIRERAARERERRFDAESRTNERTIDRERSASGLTNDCGKEKRALAVTNLIVWAHNLPSKLGTIESIEALRLPQKEERGNHTPRDRRSTSYDLPMVELVRLHVHRADKALAASVL
jgi:hypothetical protein